MNRYTRGGIGDVTKHHVNKPSDNKTRIKHIAVKKIKINPSELRRLEYNTTIIPVHNNQYTKGCGNPDGLSSQAKYTR